VSKRRGADSQDQKYLSLTN